MIRLSKYLRKAVEWNIEMLDGKTDAYTYRHAVGFILGLQLVVRNYTTTYRDTDYRILQRLKLRYMSRER